MSDVVWITFFSNYFPRELHAVWKTEQAAKDAIDHFTSMNLGYEAVQVHEGVPSYKASTSENLP